LSAHRSRKRSRSQLEESSDESQARERSSDRDTIADFLPSKSTADALVSAYFDRVHMYMPLFSRRVFQMRLEATYLRRAEPLEECKDSGWLVVLALVFSFGCQRLEEPDPKQARELKLKYLGFARAYFRQLLTTASLDNVQALVLLNIHHHSVGQKSSSWLLIGLAARMVSSLIYTLPVANASS
jgi:separase